MRTPRTTLLLGLLALFLLTPAVLLHTGNEQLTDAGAGPSAARVAVARATIHDPAPTSRHRKTGAESDVPVPAGVNVFALASRPGAARTIYLDFTGGTLPAKTIWSYNDPVAYAPYTADAATDTQFSAQEASAIYTAWATVAEDFAVFDVNVTTQHPGDESLTRTHDTDGVYGLHVAITPSGSNVHEIACHLECGGIAALDAIEKATYQPAWVFSPPWRPGIGIGKTASHEIGHALGLLHDGTSGVEYFSGNDRWAPIMGGAPDSLPLSHWSPGDYPDASNIEDDLSVMSRWLPLVADDHGDTTAPTPIGTTPVSGLIGSRSDIDAFSFTASGKVSVQVQNSVATDLDVDLRLVTPGGTLIGHANEPVEAYQDPGAPGLDAVWHTTLGATPRTLIAAVDGAGQGQWPAGYSDYGSLGRYTISVTPGPSAPRFQTVQLRPARPTVWWHKRIAVTGSLGDLDVTRSGKPPAGMRVKVSENGRTVRLSGRPARAGTYRFWLTATDMWGDATTKKIVIRVDAPKKPVRRPARGEG